MADFMRCNRMNNELVPNGHCLGEYTRDISPGGDAFRVSVSEPATAEHVAKQIEARFARFPGLFNECWLYVNGDQVAERKLRSPVRWLNDYRFEWDVDLSGKLTPGVNVISLRFYNPHHFGGMSRRPFLYTAMSSRKRFAALKMWQNREAEEGGGTEMNNGAQGRRGYDHSMAV